MPEKDVDEQFAAIMAHWNDEALGLDPSGDPQRDDDQLHPESHSPNIVPSTTSEPAWLELPEVARLRDVPEPADEKHTDARSEDPTDDLVEDAMADQVAPDLDDDVHYTPPPPAPLPPSDDKHFWTMIVALVAGPLLFLYLLLFNRDGNGWWMMFALLVSIAGFVLLVLRQPLDRDEDDDGIRL
jgi:hypothetical protein